jgi:glycosyltransferase involved in cell wall biosynthesis
MGSVIVAPTLSLILAVKNEADKVEGCLESLQWVDEIVVVDMFSTDDTVEICRKYTDKVYQHDGGPLGQIGANFNYGMDRASSDWVLLAAADERVSPEFAIEVREAISSGEFQAYWVPWVNYFAGRFLTGRLGLGYALHLLKRNLARFPADSPHEQLPVSCPVGRLKTAKLHYTHPELADFLRKMNLYTSQDAAVAYANKTGGWGHYGKPLSRVTWWVLVTHTVREFGRSYVWHQGFRHGMHGFVFSMLMAFYVFVDRAKIWELQYKAERHISSPWGSR